VHLTFAGTARGAVKSFNVYRGPHGGTLSIIGSTTASPFDDLGLPAGAYDYAVTAVAASGTESDRSNVVTVAVAGGAGGAQTRRFFFAPTGDATIDATTAEFGAAPILRNPMTDVLSEFDEHHGEAAASALGSAPAGCEAAPRGTRVCRAS
jgi:hypothetical protein